MVIEVRLYATLRRYAPQDATAGVFAADLSDDSTVGDLVQDIGIDPSEVHILMVNGAHSSLERVLQDSDRVGLFPAVGGG